MKIKLEKIRCAYTELFNRWKETQINNDNDYFEEQLSILTDIIEQAEEKYKCKNCGGEINKGEFDTFEVCDGCWDKPEEKVYGPQKCNKWAPIPWFQKGTKEVE